MQVTSCVQVFIHMSVYQGMYMFGTCCEDWCSLLFSFDGPVMSIGGFSPFSMEGLLVELQKCCFY